MRKSWPPNTRKIRVHPHPVLKQVAAEVPKGENMRPLVDEMFRAMRAADGMGLAASQLGEPVRVIIGESKKDNWEFVLINPTVKRKWGTLFTHKEGCLSFPESIGKRVTVIRPKEIQVRGFDLNWEQVTIGGKHWKAFCLQHELDHLDGLCIDRFT